MQFRCVVHDKHSGCKVICGTIKSETLQVCVRVSLSFFKVRLMQFTEVLSLLINVI